MGVSARALVALTAGIIQVSIAPAASQRADIQVVPDVVVRGRTSRIVVTGPNIAVLESLDVRGEGITIEPFALATPPREGVAAMEYKVTVNANAAPGPRDLTVVDPSRVQVTVRTSSDLPPELTASLEKDLSALSAVDAGTIHINSHELAVAQLTFSGTDRLRPVRLVVTDAAGDFAIGDPDAFDMHLQCDQGRYDGNIVYDVAEQRQPNGVVITGTLNTRILGGRSGCTAHVQLKDKSGNRSPEFVAKLDAQ